MSKSQVPTPPVVSSDVVSLTGPAVVALTFYEKLEQKKKAENTIVSVEDFANMLADTDEELAEQYVQLFHTIRPLEKGDKWRPLLLSIASKKGNDEAYTNAGAGGIFVHETKKAVPKSTLFFPLYSHFEHTWWQDSKASCRSIDGVKGQRFKGPNSPGIITCGTNCPNTPDPFQKSEDPCKWTQPLYLVDSNFTNIYTVLLRYFGVDKTYGVMLKATKEKGNKFDARGSNWFTLSAFEKGVNPQKMGWYHEGRETDEAVTETQSKVIGQLKALMAEYHHAQIDQRDSGPQIAQGVIEQIEVTGVIEDSDDFSHEV